MSDTKAELNSYKAKTSGKQTLSKETDCVVSLRYTDDLPCIRII